MSAVLSSEAPCTARAAGGNDRRRMRERQGTPTRAREKDHDSVTEAGRVRAVAPGNLLYSLSWNKRQAGEGANVMRQGKNVPPPRLTFSSHAMLVGCSSIYSCTGHIFTDPIKKNCSSALKKPRFTSAIGVCVARCECAR
eukprot:scaffold31210_cov110-Isochrysis_galbana.AAC.2